MLLEKMRCDAYGAKSEKLERNVDQWELKLEELESDQAADEVVGTTRLRQCMVRRATARGSVAEKTSLRKCIRPLSGD